MVTVAVVSWNTRGLLLRCLESLAGEVSAGRAQVWVVDNGSTDHSVEAARTGAPWAQVVGLEQNVGFGRAVNLVAAESHSEWLLAANADTALGPGALSALLAAGRDPSAGCVAPRLVLPDGATQHSVHPFPTLSVALTFNLGLHRLSTTLGERLCLEGFWDCERPRDVPWAIGACLLLRRAAFEQVGGFDERQWLYAEDLDLGWRLAQAGWVTRYQPQAIVQHAAGAATTPAFGARKRASFMTASYAVLSRRLGPLQAAAIALVNIGGAAARLAWLTPLALISRRFRPLQADNRHWLLAHLRGLRGLSGTPAGGASTP